MIRTAKMLRLRTHRAVLGYTAFIVTFAFVVTHLVLWLGLPRSDYHKYWLLATCIDLVLGLALGYFGGLMIHKNTALSESLEYMASHDQMTGCLTRGKYFDLCKQGDLTPGVVILIDIDHFKSVNDSYGHNGGDLALLHLVKVLRGILGPKDLMSRFGGEEFVILLPFIDEQQGLDKAREMCNALRAAPLLMQGKSLTLTASFGVAPIVYADDIDAAVRNADVAMYKAKLRGRDRVCRFEPDFAHLLVPSSRTPKLEPEDMIARSREAKRNRSV